MLEKFIFTSCYILHRLIPLLGTKLGFFLCPFPGSTSSRLALAGAFPREYVAACSTALRSATEENESGGHVTVRSPPKVKQHSSTADWLKV